MPDPSPLSGRTISHYRIIEKIGAGGMGEVYRVHDEQLDRDVALKILPAGLLANEAARKQFRKEALALAKLNHPNIETVYEFGSQDGVDFLAMELIPGESLRKKIKAGPLAEREIIRLGVQLAEGLAAAHDQGIIHRDLKPGNLFVTPDGRLKILDFGLARLIHPELANDVTRSITVESGTISGTVPYMPPEQLRGEPTDPRSDIYAAGAVLYEMATGQRAFPQTHGPTLMGAILHQPAASPSSLNARISPNLESVILKALEKEPSQRYQSARELRVALEGISFSGAASSSVSAQAAAPSAAPAAARQFRWPLIVGAAAVVALAAAGSYFYFHRAPKLTDKDTIVLADFANSTGDPVFDSSLRQGLSVQLEQSPFLSIVSDQQIQQTLRLMGQKPDAKLTPEIARELCQRTSSAAVLEGSITQIGTPYLLTVKAINCVNGESLASTEAQASDKNHVLDALGKTASEMRRKLGESLSTVERFDTPLEQATTPSLEALKAYSSGHRVMGVAGTYAADIPFFKQAIELDPNFAVAYAWLGVEYTSIGEPSIAAGYARKGYELRNRASEPERYFISAVYHKQVTGDIEQALQSCKLWIQAYPRMDMPHNYLAGAIYPVIGEYEKGVEESREAIRLNPEFPVPYAFLMSNSTSLSRLDDAKAAYEQAVARKLHSAFYPLTLYEIAFLNHDTAGMAQQVATSAGQTALEDELLSMEADTAAYSGRLGAAREFSRRAVDSAERAGEKETTATYSAMSGLREALFGNPVEARRHASLAMEHSPGIDAQYGSALALAYAGDAGRAQALMDDLDKKFPEATIVQFNYLPTLRAKLALSNGNASEALASLRAVPYELGQTTYSVARWTSLYPVFVRGEVYLAAHQGSEAAAEFQKILDHRGIVVNEPIGALAHLQIGRAYAMAGDTAKAKSAYQDFLTLWKDADSDIPILKQAKAEYAELQ